MEISGQKPASLFYISFMQVFKPRFFMKETSKIAEELLGSYVVRKLGKKRLVGKIVETEAYLGLSDSCCHSFKGTYTPRTKTMYLKGGHSYVYFTYGMHHCFNVVTRGEKEPEAVLIRALEPIEGLDIMKKNRNKEKRIDLCSGPGKLCQAFDITRSFNAKDLSQKGEIYLAKGKREREIEVDSRVGLPLHEDSAYCLLRFYVKNNPFVSVKKSQLA